MIINSDSETDGQVLSTYTLLLFIYYKIMVQKQHNNMVNVV
jgi:hypothetical protein